KRPRRSLRETRFNGAEFAFPSKRDLVPLDAPRRALGDSVTAAVCLLRFLGLVMVTELIEHRISSSQKEEPISEKAPNENINRWGTALVTGAGSGIGRQLAVELSRRGWSVAALDTDPESLAGLDSQMKKDERRFASAVVDVTDAVSLEEQVSRLSSTLGSIDL